MTTTILSRRFVMEMEIMIIAYHRQIGHRTMKNIYYENCIQGVGDSIRCSLFPRGARRKSINVQNFDVMDMIFFSFFFKTTKNILFSHAHTAHTHTHTHTHTPHTPHTHPCSFVSLQAYRKQSLPLTSLTYLSLSHSHSFKQQDKKPI
jgi:hypothetical protein